MKFDHSALLSALIARREAGSLSWREVARQAQISPATLTRIRQGQDPDISTFGALIHWLGVPAETFLGRAASGQSASRSPLAAFLGDQPMTPKQTIALAELVKSAYQLVQTAPAVHRRKAV